MVPKMLDTSPPVTRPRMLEVARPESLRKFAMLLLGTLKSPKLWNRLVPPPGRVPPVMSNWVWPLGRLIGADTAVSRPDDVIVWARETEHGRARRRKRPNMRW